LGSAEKVATEMATSYPTPAHSITAWFGDFASNTPRKEQIIADDCSGSVTELRRMQR
jgi:hypothetical protein